MTSYPPPGECACGQPLHYTDSTVQAIVDRLVAEHGATVVVEVAGTFRKFLVPRHYIALHGLKATALPALGFEEVLHSGESG